MSLLEKILEKKEQIKTSSGENVKIDSIMIEENGREAEHFYQPDGLHEMRSISKVMIALAYGIALDRGMLVNEKPLTLDTKVWPVLKNLGQIRTAGNLEKIQKWTIKTLLTYSGGWDKQMFSRKFLKVLESQGKTESDYLDYVLNYPLSNEPNEKYVYNNAETFVLSVYFQEAFGENITDFIAREIFAPLGIKHFVWQNFAKYCPGCTGLYLSHRDLYKIGQLILAGGEFRSKRIVSQDYVKQMCSVQIETPYAIKPERVLYKLGVGFVMYISRDGFVFKDGNNGQYLIVNFKKNLLLTILSSESEMKYVTEILRDLI